MESAAVVLQAIGLTKSYPLASETVAALSGVDLELRAGEVVALVGASGSGKSTLLSLLGCLDRPTAGTIRVTGKTIDGLSEHDLAGLRRRSIGFVFQESFLIPTLTALENTGLPLAFGESSQVDRSAPAQALEKVGLTGKESRYPGELSGGERQRVAIARALVHRPALLLADEPTGNLDSGNGRKIFALFLDLAARHGICTLVATHNEELARMASRIVHLRDGRILNGGAS
ncbi:MAG TPA: ABC transporter ATP-binding protein [Candidatus Polarisedimenticolia bacterium]|nr:ABC transporter ATP-binding protein [Candidatus Polarisedimenticolia bacterium]